MLDSATKHKIDSARDILVGKVPDPKSQVEQITIAMIYKFMDDMDKESEQWGGKPSFFTGKFAKYAWSKIFDPRLSGFELIALYGEAIITMNHNPNIPQLFRDIFKNAYLPYRDPETLKSFLKQINEFHYTHSEKLGDAFEYLLSVLSSQGDAGQFRTPRHIIDFIVEIVNPKKNETILDPACGTAGFLISSYKHILRENSSQKPETKLGNNIGGINGTGRLGDLLNPDERKRMIANFVGYDISPDMVRLSLVNMYLHGFSEPHIYEYDTLTSEDRWNDTFDVILANPPFMSPKGGIRPHKRFAIQAKRSEVLFVDYIAEHLNPNGRAGIIVPEGIIFQSQTAYKDLRRMLVENYLYAVVSLPAGVFNPYSGVKTSILLLDKALAKKTDEILFVKVENDGYDLGAQRRPIDRDDLPGAMEIVKDYCRSIMNNLTFSLTQQILSIAILVKKKKISEIDTYLLTGERYKIESSIASNYELVRLGDVCQTISGGTPLKNRQEYYQGGTIPWLKSGEVAKGFIFDAKECITELGLKNSSAKILPVNAVLVAMYGATAGQVGILKFTAATNQAICGILPNNNYIAEFLYYILKSRKDFLVKLSGGGAQPNISQTIIKDLIIPLPSLEVQKDIVDELDSYQRIIDGARQQIKSHEQKIQNKIKSIWGI